MQARIAAIAAGMAILALPAAAAAQQQTFGSTLQATPLTQQQGGDCGAWWFPNTNNLNASYFPTNSGAADCTWYQGFVFGNTDDPRKGYVPGDGVVNTITVKSGATPAPLEFVILRQLTQAQLGAPTGTPECCFFVRKIGEGQPQPNTTTTFTVNAPVENNKTDKVITQDIIGFSAASGAGSIPLGIQDNGTTGRFNEGAHFTNGEMTSGWFRQKLGSLANDSGGGRHETNTYGGFDVLLQYTWTPQAAISPTQPPAEPTATPAPITTVPNVPPVTGPTPLSPTDVVLAGGSVLRPIGTGLDATIACLQPTCAGTATLLTRAHAAKQTKLGSKKFSLKKGADRKIHIPLSAKGRLLAKKGQTKVTLVIDLGTIGKTSKNLTMAKLKPAKKAKKK